MQQDPSQVITRAILKEELQKEFNKAFAENNAKNNKELLSQLALRDEQLLADFKDAFSDRTVQQDDKIVDLNRRMIRVEGTLNLAA